MGYGMRVVVALVCVGSAAGLTAGNAPRRQWKLGEFTWVKRLAAEVGAPVNEHPAKVQVEALRQQLGAIQFTAGKDSEALFAPEELAQLVEPLCEALSVAGPGDDLLLLSTHRRGGSFLNTSYGVTARFFVHGGSLNLIVHDTRLDFVDRYRATQALPEFHFGSRNTASAIELKSPGATSRRCDWLAFPLKVEAAPSTSESAAPVAAGVAPKVRDAAFFDALEKRLRALKHLREQNLITEEDYQEKRREMLKGL